MTFENGVTCVHIPKSGLTQASTEKSHIHVLFQKGVSPVHPRCGSPLSARAHDRASAFTRDSTSTSCTLDPLSNDVLPVYVSPGGPGSSRSERSAGRGSRSRADGRGDSPSPTFGWWSGNRRPCPPPKPPDTPEDLDDERRTSLSLRASRKWSPTRGPTETDVSPQTSCVPPTWARTEPGLKLLSRSRTRLRRPWTVPPPGLRAPPSRRNWGLPPSNRKARRPVSRRQVCPVPVPPTRPRRGPRPKGPRSEARKRTSDGNVWNCYSMYTSIDRRRSCRRCPSDASRSAGSMYFRSSAGFRPRHCYSGNSAWHSADGRPARDIFSTFICDVRRSCRATRPFARSGWSCHVSVSFGSSATTESAGSSAGGTSPLRYGGGSSGPVFALRAVARTSAGASREGPTSVAPFSPRPHCARWRAGLGGARGRGSSFLS